MQQLVSIWTTRENQFRAWVGGTAGGGPNSDGRYPLTDGEGNTFLVACPAALTDGGTAPAAQAIAGAATATAKAAEAVAARDVSVSAKDLSVAAQVAAVAAKDLTLVAKGDAMAAAVAAASDKIAAQFARDQAVAAAGGGSPSQSYVPNLTFGGGAVGLTYYNRTARYLRIGDWVHYQGRMFLSAKGTSTGQARISLPFTARSDLGLGAADTAGFLSIMAAGFTQPSPCIIPLGGQNRGDLYYSPTGGIGPVMDTDIGGNAVLCWNFAYYTSDP